MIEYYKFELIDQLMTHYFNSCATTLDTSDFVPQRYLKKIQRRLFKEFKSKMWVLGFEYKRFKKYWKKNKNMGLDENLNAIYAKYSLEFKNAMQGDNNSFLKRPTQDCKPEEINPAYNERGVWGKTSPAVDYYDCTNSIEDEEIELDAPKQEDDLASADIKEQLEERSSNENGIEPL